ncbi:SLC13 family permease [Allopontixanthobacter sp.]|uniref:SLC13 family permease n=1 Tax=Allopontixanthobacter sp. TaxID=2906452 RepID=UPI002AB9580B|nr:SLC13 family permease [Allopontixanthobacter sp.]MDZ4307891.1 SLC13 family permease [Allopontixanthobacter sp.]
MSFDQAAIMLILGTMLVVYASERFRVEVVAMSGLAAAFVIGVVPGTSVFAGFASPAVITVVEILLVVAALANARSLDGISRRLTARLKSETAVILFLCVAGAVISVFMNNIGALALMFPIAISLCARAGIAPARVLMPLSFATLLGGMCSLTGTPANLVVNEWMAAETGRNLGYFELAQVGGPLAVFGILCLVLVTPRIFTRFAASDGSPSDAGPSDFLAERMLASSSRFVGLHIAEFELKSALRIHGVVRHGAHVFARRQDIVLSAGDILMVEGAISLLEELEGDGEIEPPYHHSDEETVELIVMPDSLLLGSRVEDLEALSGPSVRVAALASRRGRIEGRFADLPLSMGDVIVLTGAREAIRQLAGECGLLALSPRRLMRRQKNALAGVGLFAIGVLVTAFGLLPVEVAFGAVVLALAMTGILNLRTALADVNWGIVILLACMIPLGLAVEETGAARVIADHLADLLPFGEPLVVVLAVLAMAVAITPFVDNVSTAVVLSPIAAGLATRTGTPVEPLLIAVAIGASLDFLTPFGHHNNAVVMGAGGYRFSDFPRLGVPLTLVCLVVAAVVFALLLAM